MTSLVRAAGLGALTLFLMSTAASADIGLRGSIDADYNSLNGDDVDANLWNVNGNFVFGISPEFNIQAGGGYHNLDGDGFGGDAWDVRGAAFWRGEQGDIGVSIAHGSFSPDTGSGSDFDVTAYGLFGEWFASERVTLAAHGGLFDGDLSLDGQYYGGGVKFYILPTLSLAGNVDRVHFDDLGHVTDLNLTAEWQVMADKPFTVYGAYTNSDFSGTDFNIDTFMIGLRWRFGEQGPASLVMGDRTNVVRNTTVNFGSAFSF